MVQHMGTVKNTSVVRSGKRRPNAFWNRITSNNDSDIVATTICQGEINQRITRDFCRTCFRQNGLNLDFGNHVRQTIRTK